MPQPSSTYPFELRRKLPGLKGCLVWCLVVWWAVLQLWARPAEARENSMVNLGAFNYPPFYYEDGGEIRGIAVDLVEAVFDRMGMGVRLSLYPLKRALEYAREGKIDGIMILIKTADRSAYMVYTDPVMSVRGLIWSRAGRSGGPVHFNQIKELRSYRMGATLGYSYGQALDSLMETMTVERVASDYLNYKKLLAGRIDIFPGNEIVARGLFKRHKELQGKFVHSNRSFVEWVLHMGISKKSRLVKYLPDINKALNEIREQGILDEAVKAFTE